MILSESTRVERVAHITYQLITSRDVCTEELAEQMGVTRRTIQRDLSEISRVLPIYSIEGSWFFVDHADQISPF